jgi:membrane associated rhomboid family serine protease
MRPASVGFQCPSCVKEGSAALRPVKTAYGGLARRNPEVTYALLGLNLLFFVLTAGSGSAVGLGGGGLSELFQKLALTPTLHAEASDGGLVLADGVAQGQYYRLLTSMFLHFGVIHLALNMYCLFLVGPGLERALGRLRFAALYLLSGLGGSALSYALGPQTEIAAGASGAVFGLFAGYYVLERKRGSDVSTIATTILINLVFGFAVPNIDWRGHVGGLVAGALVTTALVHAPPGKQRWLYQALGSLAVAMVVVAVVGARTLQLTD